MDTDMKVPVTNIQRLSTHDGPGIRTTVFLKGCFLNCVWCHNPETKKITQELLYTAQKCINCGQCAFKCANSAHVISETGTHILIFERCRACMNCVKICPAGALEPACTMMTPEEIMLEVLKDIAFYGKKGGVTLSGGEPLTYFEQTLEIFRLAKQHNISSAIETCGYFDERFIQKMPELTEVTDLFLWDYKDTNPQRHLKYTGASAEKILRNLFLTDDIITQNTLNTSIILRCIMVKGVNMNHEHYDGIAEIFSRLKNCAGVELILCHALGNAKNKQLGLEETCRGDWCPSQDEIENVRDILINKNVKIIN